MSTKKRRGKQRIAPFSKQSGTGKNALLCQDAVRILIHCLLREITEKFAVALEMFSHDNSLMKRLTPWRFRSMEIWVIDQT